MPVIYLTDQVKDMGYKLTPHSKAKYIEKPECVNISPMEVLSILCRLNL